MVKTSTLFYFYDEFNIENELYEPQELNEPGDLYTEDLEKIFGGIEFSPRDEVLRKILEEI